MKTEKLSNKVNNVIGNSKSLKEKNHIPRRPISFKAPNTSDKINCSSLATSLDLSLDHWFNNINGDRNCRQDKIQLTSFKILITQGKYL